MMVEDMVITDLQDLDRQVVKFYVTQAGDERQQRCPVDLLAFFMGADDEVHLVEISIEQ